jgi:hypothetical protein
MTVNLGVTSVIVSQSARNDKLAILLRILSGKQDRNDCFIRSGSQHRPIATTTDSKFQRIDYDRFARSRLSRQNSQSGTETYPGMLHQRKIIDLDAMNHKGSQI